MNGSSAPPREDVRWAPSIITLKIDPEKIRDVIGKAAPSSARSRETAPDRYRE